MARALWGGSGEGPPRARPLPAIRPRPCRSAVLHYLAIRSPRAFLTKVRSFRPLTPCFARVLVESVLVPAFALVFRARFRRKCARRGSYCGASGAFSPDLRPVRGPGQQGPARAEVLTPQKNFARAVVPPPQDNSGRSGPPGACQLKRRTKTRQQKRVNKKYVYLHT